MCSSLPLSWVFFLFDYQVFFSARDFGRPSFPPLIFYYVPEFLLVPFAVFIVSDDLTVSFSLVHWELAGFPLVLPRLNSCYIFFIPGLPLSFSLLSIDIRVLSRSIPLLFFWGACQNPFFSFDQRVGLRPFFLYPFPPRFDKTRCAPLSSSRLVSPPTRAVLPRFFLSPSRDRPPPFRKRMNRRFQNGTGFGSLHFYIVASPRLNLSDSAVPFRRHEHKPLLRSASPCTRPLRTALSLPTICFFPTIW